MGADTSPPAKASPEALQALREASQKNPGARWAAYQNMAMDSTLLGHLQFLAVGPTNTYNDPPARYPADTSSGLGWRYLFIGWVDLETGVIDDCKEPRG